MNNVESILSVALGVATLLPLLSFFVILVVGPRLRAIAGWLATGAIGVACLISLVMLFVIWLPSHPIAADHGHGEHRSSEHADLQNAGGGLDAAGEHDAEETHEPSAYAGDYYPLGVFGDLRITIGYYIDSLTLCMFCMVTLIATCIHFYAMGYMHEELDETVTDPEVTTADGTNLKRPGRYPRFFQYLSLFCFSMLGLVLAGNIAMVFVFWELVGICSYFLIGFYVERKSASTAANKAFIVNRVGDFGMIIGLMALWASLGTFAFGDYDADEDGEVDQGIFSLVRPEETGHQLQVPDRMVQAAAHEEVAAIVKQNVQEYGVGDYAQAISDEEVRLSTDGWRSEGHGYWLLIIAGVGIFCGCVGKSAQFPLHVWLPDAMEGPTPVSALVHSATMVAAGVYLVGRFFPVFATEVLLVIAIAGCITLFMAATIAITATDIKRVLAYSTVSQLGYMMLALGVGGWLAGMMHLFTHAFFKSLLFMCSGSVIHAVHTNEMPQMGGLLKKMPVTAITMLIGCLAIAGAAIPFVVGLSGYYSKDAILEQAFSFMKFNGTAWSSIFFVAAAGGATITAFYMFRMWFMTFVGKPRDEHRYEHAHESPAVMYVPLVVLAVFAVAVAWDPMTGIIGGVICAAISAVFIGRHRKNAASTEHAHEHHHEADHHADDHHGDDHHGDHHHALSPKLIYLPLALSVIVILASLAWLPMSNVKLSSLLEESRPAGTAIGHEPDFVHTTGQLTALVWPHEHAGHADEIKIPVTLLAFGTAVVGIALAAAFYWFGVIKPDDVRNQFRPVYRFLVHKWWFDELYDFLFVRPTLVIGRLIAAFDRRVIDWFVDNLARVTEKFSVFWDKLADQTIVDGLVNLFAGWTHSLGVGLRRVQTGRLREYVMFIVLGTIVIFVLISFFWTPTS